MNPNPKAPGGGQLIQSSPRPFELPANFQSPFKRVAMQERMDDAFACIATLTGKSLEEVNRTAIALGYPAQGPAYPTELLIAKLLMSLGRLLCTNYKEFSSLSGLPDVAIVLVDWDEDMEIGRTVIWHRVRQPDVQVPSSFAYVIDPATWIAEDRFMHTDVDSLQISWYMAVTAAHKKTGTVAGASSEQEKADRRIK